MGVLGFQNSGSRTQSAALTGVVRHLPGCWGKKNPTHQKKPKPNKTDKPKLVRDVLFINTHTDTVQFPSPSPLISFLFPKVRHRWCELVVKHKYVPGYGDVETFLREDQVSYI